MRNWSGEYVAADDRPKRAARAEFLRALHALHPEALHGLLAAVEVKYQLLPREVRARLVASDWPEQADDPLIVDLEHALEAWAKPLGLAFPWMYNVALTTLYVLDIISPNGRAGLTWHQPAGVRSELLLEGDAVTLTLPPMQWFPREESWEGFRNRVLEDAAAAADQCRDAAQAIAAERGWKVVQHRRDRGVAQPNQNDEAADDSRPESVARGHAEPTSESASRINRHFLWLIYAQVDGKSLKTIARDFGVRLNAVSVAVNAAAEEVGVPPNLRRWRDRSRRQRQSSHS